MPKRVVCTLPNASELINGVEFEHTLDGVISKDVLPDDVAVQFQGIPGYKLVEAEKPAEKPAKSGAKE